MRMGFASIVALSVAASAMAQVPTTTNYPPPIQNMPRSVPTPITAGPPASMQWLYGSGEAAAASMAAYNALRDYVILTARNRPRDSVVVALGSTLPHPSFVSCGRKPLAVVLDVDETALLNLGYEYDQAAQNRSYDAKRWSDWERTGVGAVAPVPGAAKALGAIRAAGVKVIFNTNRMVGNATYTELALDAAGLGPARHLKELFLEGDAPGGSAKDARRALIASRYCVVAMAGDQLGDFTDLFNSKGLPIFGRRETAMTGWIAQMWGNGWFVLPNPVYGTGVRGSFDDVFPFKRWSDPAGGQ
jgi:5'-nucleotidase (lipoprotein e(P4) family)